MLKKSLVSLDHFARNTGMYAPFFCFTSFFPIANNIVCNVNMYIQIIL